MTDVFQFWGKFFGVKGFMNLRSRNPISIGFLAELIGKSASIESSETGFLESSGFSKGQT